MRSSLGIAQYVAAVAFAAVAILATVELRSDRAEKLIAGEMSLREVEVSIWEAGAAANRFALSASPAEEREYSKQLRDVDTHLTEFGAGGTRSGESDGLVRFQTAWAEVVAELEKVKPLRLELREALELSRKELRAAGDSVDFRVRAVDPSDANSLERSRLIRDFEVATANAMLAANTAVLAPRGGTAIQLAARLNEIKGQFEAYGALNPPAREAQAVVAFQDHWKSAALAIERAIEAARQLDASRIRSTQALHLADDIIDFELQADLFAEMQAYHRGRKLRLWLVLGTLTVGALSVLWGRKSGDPRDPEAAR